MTNVAVSNMAVTNVAVTNSAWSDRFSGTSALTRLALRRDRLLIPLWVLLFAAMAAGSAAATRGVYVDLAAQVGAASAVNRTIATRALYGPIWDQTSLGQLALFKVGALGAALVAVLSFLLVTRHSRGEEEEGRLELLGAGVVGRYAALSAALLVAAATDAVLATVTWVGLGAAGLPWAGSLAFVSSWAVTGLVFAAVAGVSAQLTSGARAANGWAGAVLGLAYLLRAVADASGGPTAASGPAGLRALSWLSPIGWAQQVRAFSANRWPVLLLGLGLTAALTRLAFVLVGRRDLGAGLFAERPGPSRAGARLGSAFGLAWRLQRGTLLAWTLAYLVLGLVLGSLATSVGDFLDTDAAKELIRRLGGQQSLTDAFFSTEFGVVGVVTTVFAVQSVLRLSAQESQLRAEPVLATAVTRERWMLGHLGVAVLGVGWLLLVIGLVGGATYAIAAGDGGQLPRLLGAALAQLPAVLVLTALTAAAYGISARLAIAGWAALVAFLVLGEFGPLLGLDQRLLELSPYAHLPRLPGGPVAAVPLIGLTVVALLLLATGLVAFRRRDLG